MPVPLNTLYHIAQPYYITTRPKIPLDTRFDRSLSADPKKESLSRTFFLVWVRNISPSRPLRKPVSLIRNYIYLSDSVFIWCNVLIFYWHIRIVSMLFTGVSVREIPLSHACHANTVSFATFNVSLSVFLSVCLQFVAFQLEAFEQSFYSLSRVTRISSQFPFAVLNKYFALLPKCNNQRSTKKRTKKNDHLIGSRWVPQTKETRIFLRKYFNEKHRQAKMLRKLIHTGWYHAAILGYSSKYAREK